MASKTKAVQKVGSSTKDTAVKEEAPETRADKLWTVIGWIYEEAAGLAGLARSWSERIRRSHAADVN